MPRFLPAFIRRRLERLRFPQLALLTVLLFVVTLVVPDPLPFLDEILLGLGTLLLTSWKRSRSDKASGRSPAPPALSERTERR
ncbi:DUF6116 family protein [Aquimonas sp.]|jgi:hypothetical protein|uniref:DUF6116 family protein n=1 Tax=Aquimonas sp. TaxID=1872588 RepID=UPI0037C042F2